jgi:hypothetical protein
MAKKHQQDLKLLKKKSQMESERNKRELRKAKEEAKSYRTRQNPRAKKKLSSPIKPKTSVKDDLSKVKSWISDQVERMMAIRHLERELSEHIEKRDEVDKK